MRSSFSYSKFLKKHISFINDLENRSISLQLKSQVQSQDFNFAYYLGFQDALSECKKNLLTSFNSSDKL